MSAVERVIRFPVNALEYTNILLTTDDANVGNKRAAWSRVRASDVFRQSQGD